MGRVAATPGTKREAAAAGLDRPLLLTRRENLAGYVGSHMGRAALFLVTATSVVAVLLILVFIVREAVGFFVDPAGLPPPDWTSPGSAFSWMRAAVSAAAARLGALLANTQWYPVAVPPEFGADGPLGNGVAEAGGQLAGVQDVDDIVAFVGSVAVSFDHAAG